MEKQLNDLSKLTSYQNRQVILNYYQNEMLYKRDGFHFLSIHQTETVLIFTKMDGTAFTIEHRYYPSAYINKDFPNYYTLRNNEEQLDIYFP